MGGPIPHLSQEQDQCAHVLAVCLHAVLCYLYGNTSNSNKAPPNRFRTITGKPKHAGEIDLEFFAMQSDTLPSAVGTCQNIADYDCLGELERLQLPLDGAAVTTKLYIAPGDKRSIPKDGGKSPGCGLDLMHLL